MLYVIVCVLLIICGQLSSGIRAIKESNQKLDWQRDFNTLCQLVVMYPHVESEQYIKSWKPEYTDTQALRYDAYCTMVFNFINKLWEASDKDMDEANRLVYITEYVDAHYYWWFNNADINKLAYDKAFILAIEDLHNNKSNEVA